MASRIGWVLVLVAVGGCLRSAVTSCDNGGVCPPGLHCGMAGYVPVCVPPTCGNERLDPLEACDDGNNLSGDGCPADCTAPCGDHILDPGEACDDGNTIGGDGCAADCRSDETCGNAFLDPGEDCDDGGTLSHDGCSSRCTIEQPAWTSLDAAPAARADHAMVYDPVRGNAVLFGGRTSEGPSSETWTWDGSLWRHRSPATVPPARVDQAMAYDATRQRVVMLGGTPLATDGTWLWDGSTWTEQIQHDPFPPPPLTGAAMAYDPARQRMVLFGGATTDGVAQRKTWAWDGTTWRELSISGLPPARSGHAMAYDARRRAIVMFGGIAAGRRLGDTWELDGSRWIQAATSGPASRAHHHMSFDAARGSVVMFGGDGDTGPLADTWEWNGAQWTAPAIPAVPRARSGAAMAYDVVHGTLVLFGGSGSAGLSDDTWEWNGAVWTLRAIHTALPLGRQALRLFHDPLRSRIVLFAKLTTPGTLFEPFELWEWDGTNWLPSAFAGAKVPAMRFGFGMSSHGATQLLFGGLGQFGGELDDTWVLSGAQWTQLTPSRAPPGRQGFPMAYDEQRNKTVMFGGQIDSEHVMSDTWEFDGSTWNQLTPAHVPAARHDAAMAYDRDRGRVVMFGGATLGSDTSGEPIELAVDETWQWDGADWTRLVAASAPPARWQAAMVYDPLRHTVVLFGGATSGPPLGDTWEWDGTGWRQRTPATQPPARSGHVMAFDPRSGHVMMFGGTGSDSFDDLWEWDGTDWRMAVPDRTPPARARSAIAYDPASTTALLFGGENQPFFGYPRLSDTWIWNGVAWRQRLSSATPAPRADHAMAFDPVRQVYVLFGGATPDLTQRQPDLTARFDDTWEWDGAGWAERIPAHRPAKRSGHGMAYDAARGALVMFGGSTDFGELLADQWQWDGSDWKRVTPSLTPPPRRDFGFTYDAARHTIVLFGGETSSSVLGDTVLGDTWEWDGAIWTQRIAASGSSPLARSGAALTYDSARRCVVLLGGQTMTGELDDMWQWDGTRWTQLAASVPRARHHQAVVDDAARGALVMFGGDVGIASGGNVADVKPLGDTQLFRYEDAATPDQACHAGFDADGDGKIGCADPDCTGVCTGCGDGVCSAIESCRLCPSDCGSCQACGDFHCDPGEDCTSCPGDCEPCQSPSIGGAP